MQRLFYQDLLIYLAESVIQNLKGGHPKCASWSAQTNNFFKRRVSCGFPSASFEQPEPCGWCYPLFEKLGPVNRFLNIHCHLHGHKYLRHLLVIKQIQIILCYCPILLIAWTMTNWIGRNSVLLPLLIYWIIENNITATYLSISCSLHFLQHLKSMPNSCCWTATHQTHTHHWFTHSSKPLNTCASICAEKNPYRLKCLYRLIISVWSQTLQLNPCTGHLPFNRISLIHQSITFQKWYWMQISATYRNISASASISKICITDI